MGVHGTASLGSRTRTGAAVLALVAVVAASVAHAQRPDARDMSCDQARALVAARGAVVLTTGQYTYERYVATAQYCSHGEVLYREWITTGDGEQCNVGYTCRLRVRTASPN